jgi:hypothetical protein
VGGLEHVCLGVSSAARLIYDRGAEIPIDAEAPSLVDRPGERVSYGAVFEAFFTVDTTVKKPREGEVLKGFECVRRLEEFVGAWVSNAEHRPSEQGGEALPLILGTLTRLSGNVERWGAGLECESIAHQRCRLPRYSASICHAI